MKAYKENWMWSIACFVFTACGGSRTATVPTTIPNPAPPPTQTPLPPISPNTGPWSFSYASGIATYRVTRSAVIQKTDSSPGQRETSTNVTHESLAIEPAGENINIKAVVDSFTSTAQGLIGQVQSVEVPAEISAALTGAALVIKDDSARAACNTTSSILIADLHNLAVSFPISLSPGLSWKDSVNVQGCQAGIPTSSRLTRSFTVTGEVIYEGRPVVAIARADTARLQGEGGLQQHHLLISADGVGSATYYLDPQAGRVLRLTVDQTLSLELATVAAKSHFRQELKEEFVLAP